MKILIEGEAYPIHLLESIFDDPKFYIQQHHKGTISSVGYYHSFERNELVYMLPKVFMRDGETTVFGISKTKLVDWKPDGSIKHTSDYAWIRQMLVYFYNSLKEFKHRNTHTTLLEDQTHSELNSNIGENEYSYLDLLLTFVKFYKKNKNTILYRHIESQSNHAKKVKWDKTVRKKLPLINAKGQPVYTTVYNKKKVTNTEETLLTYFFSILYHFNHNHQLNIRIDGSYTIIKGEAFNRLSKNGLVKLRKIKYRYFSDTLRKMYRLCEMYFSQHDAGSTKHRRNEFITINNYNIVFEDMVDKVFSDPLTAYREKSHGLSLKQLKNHPDGKIIDHIYEDKSLIDKSNIFYIGDSKYYKSQNSADKHSIFKQFTYAKNVIQFNIDILNQKKRLPRNLRYRDDITEGYNISPNFFIYGYIGDELDFNHADLKTRTDRPTKSCHFPDRLFDRDTLFVHEYQMNFLFVLKAYTQKDVKQLNIFRDKAKKTFRNEFINFFNDPEQSGFFVYEKGFGSLDELKNHVEQNFRQLNGKCISVGNKLLIAFDERQSNSNLNLFEFS